MNLHDRSAPLIPRRGSRRRLSRTGRRARGVARRGRDRSPPTTPLWTVPTIVPQRHEGAGRQRQRRRMSSSRSTTCRAATGWGHPARPGRRRGMGAGTAIGTTARPPWRPGSRRTSPPTPSQGRRPCAPASLQTHVAARALFEGFLDEISAKGYRVRDGSGYSFRCTDGSGGWSCPGGDPSDLSNHAWGLAIDINAGTNPIRSYSSIDGATACMTPVQTDMPQWVIQTAEKWGLYWGGYGWNCWMPEHVDPAHRGCLAIHPTSSSGARPARPLRSRRSTCATTPTHRVDRTCLVDDAGRKTSSSADARRCRRPAVRLPVAAHAACRCGSGDGQPHRDRGRRARFPHAEDCAARSGPGDVEHQLRRGRDAANWRSCRCRGRICIYRSTAVHTIVDVSAT